MIAEIRNLLIIDGINNRIDKAVGLIRHLGNQKTIRRESFLLYKI